MTPPLPFSLDPPGSARGRIALVSRAERESLGDQHLRRRGPWGSASGLLGQVSAPYILLDLAVLRRLANAPGLFLAVSRDQVIGIEGARFPAVLLNHLCATANKNA